MSEFGIKIKDDSKTLPKFAVEHNENAVKLYDWQRRALDYFFSHDCTAIFEVTTGAGKSLAALEVMKGVLEKDPDINILIVVPKNIILERTWYTELYNGGFTLKDVGFYYGEIKEYSKITITNMQSLNRVALDIFDMIILDECFSGDTKINILDNGVKRTETIKKIVDEKKELMVLSYNINNKKQEYKKILNWHKIKERRKVINIEFVDGSILTITPEQLIFDGEKYIEGKKLKIGDRVLTR